jgi:hypothetical protein
MYIYGPGVNSASNKNEYLPGGKKRPARRADNLSAICMPNVGASTSHNPKCLHGLYRDNFTLFMCIGVHLIS